MSYMEKKTNRRQTTIVSLSDQNQKKIQDIRDQKQQMLEAYEEKKQGKCILFYRPQMKLREGNVFRDVCPRDEGGVP